LARHAVYHTHSNRPGNAAARAPLLAGVLETPQTVA